jgi:hypothetical protein
LRRQVRETLQAPGLAWIVGVTALVPAAAVLVAAAGGRFVGVDPEGPLLVRAWFLPAVTLVGALSAVGGATSIAGRAEAGVLDAMRRHGVAVTRTLMGKLGATIALAFALAAATLPAAVLCLAFGRVPALDAAFALLGIGLIAIVGPAVGLALGARIGEVRRAAAAAAGTMALVPLLLGAYARLAPRAFLGTADWTALVLYGSDVDVYLRLTALPLLGALALLGICRAVAIGALVPRDEDRFGPVRRWVPSALALAALAVGFVGLR